MRTVLCALSMDLILELAALAPELFAEAVFVAAVLLDVFTGEVLQDKVIKEVRTNSGRCFIVMVAPFMVFCVVFLCGFLIVLCSFYEKQCT